MHDRTGWMLRCVHLQHLHHHSIKQTTLPTSRMFPCKISNDATNTPIEKNKKGARFPDSVFEVKHPMAPCAGLAASRHYQPKVSVLHFCPLLIATISTIGTHCSGGGKVGINFYRMKISRWYVMQPKSLVICDEWPTMNDNF